MPEPELFKKIAVLYEDELVLVAGKPAGLIVHPDGRTEEPSLDAWFVARVPDAEGVGEPLRLADGGIVPRPGVVHRIDRDTSGAVVLAKTPAAFLFLKGQFQAGAVSKRYAAFAYGEMKNSEGVIDRPIARSRKDFRLWSAGRGAKGKEREALTRYQVRARRGGFSLVLAMPKTGRTHQIRVHLKAINHPVVCDKLYAPKRDCALGFARLALHARSLSFLLPGGKKVAAVAPFPEDFSRALSEWGIPEASL